MRREASGRLDRVLAAIEVSALGIWVGSLLAFAFAFAPLAFRIVAPLDAARFGSLVGGSLSTLALWGYVLGGLALVAALLRAAGAADRVGDAVRIVLVALALGLTVYHQRAVVPAMNATPEVRSPAYRAQHARSTQVYGGVVLLAFAALILAALRREE